MVVVQSFTVYEVPERVSATSPSGMVVIVLDTVGELVAVVLVAAMLGTIMPAVVGFLAGE